MLQRPPEFVNRRRTPAFLLPESREKAMRLVVAALLGAVAFHAMLFFLCWAFDVNLSLYSKPAPPPEQDMESRILVNVDPVDEPVEPLPEPDKQPEEIEHEPVDPPDIVDLPLEKLDIAPGDTIISLKDVKTDEVAGVEELGGKLDLKAIQKSLPDLPPDPGIANANPLTVKAPEVKDINMDDWYKDKLSSAGGQDDSMNPDGSKTLQDLLNQPGGSLGKDSGYSRLGADLLFEYDKAELKKSALVGLLQLAALMEKNPTTRFIVEGHTDSFGSLAYNRKLSYSRAAAVREWLSGNGIDLSRVYIRACAADIPVVSVQGSRENQAPNRRVEIHMRKAEEALPDGVFSARDAAPDFASMPNKPLTPSGGKALNVAQAGQAPQLPAPLPAKGNSPKPAPPKANPPKVVAPPAVAGDKKPLPPLPKPAQVGAEIVEDEPVDKARGDKSVGAEIIEDDHSPGAVGAEVVD